MKRLLIMPLAAVVFVVSTCLPAEAATYTFDFNAPSLPIGSNSSTIQTYMQGVLGVGPTVAVTPTGNVISDNGYNGDGRAVGPGTGSISTTLGTTDGSGPLHSSVACSGSNPCTGTGLDGFLKNTSSVDGTFWSFVFTGMTIANVSFDYEIFPDGSCTNISNAPNCGQANYLGSGHYQFEPDFTFSTNLGTLFKKYGTTPATGSHSPFSGAGTDEKDPQFIGTSGVLTGAFITGATTLTFTDWPATIGIDNLTITTTSAVPEPTSMLLLGSGLAAAYARRKKRKA